MLADAGEWSVPPFSGEVRDDEVWGRGALDMKGQVAANAVAIASLAREGFEPAGDLIFAATADEEVGEGFGLSWLCSEHPDAVRCDYAANEGGGDRLVLGGETYYIVGTAEKLTAPFNIAVHGRSGHASMPGIADNALVKAARLVERIAAYRPQQQIQPEVAAFLQAALGDVPPRRIGRRAHANAAHDCRRADRAAARTDVRTDDDLGVEEAEVIPARCEIVVDCRLLPGQTPGEIEPIVREMLGDDVDYDLEFLEAEGGTRSPLATPLWSAVESFVAEHRAGRRAGADDLRRVHRQPLAARGVRHRRVRLLPVSARCRRSSRRRSSTRRTSGARRRPRARGRLAAARGARRLHVTVELGSLAELEAALAADGFFARDGVVANVYIGYGCSDALRRSTAPSPPEPCALPAVAYSIEPRRTARCRRRRLLGRPVAGELERERVRGCSRSRARRDRRGRRVPGQPRTAPERRFRR